MTTGDKKRALELLHLIAANTFAARNATRLLAQLIREEARFNGENIPLSAYDADDIDVALDAIADDSRADHSSGAMCGLWQEMDAEGWFK